jgi:hypothetical protein
MTGAERFENVVQIVIMLAIGGMAGAASFTHVHDVTVAHGQPDWIGWANAVVVELMSIALGLELRRRTRTDRPTGFVITALLFFVLTSLAAQVVDAERSVIGWLAAALPAVGFLVLAKVVLSRTAAKAPTTAPATPEQPADPVDLDPITVESGGSHARDEAEQLIDLPTVRIEPQSADLVPATAPAIPLHLLPTARFAVVNHEQTTGRPITADELAARMSVTTTVAGQLLHAIDEPARINGSPIGAAR